VKEEQQSVKDETYLESEASADEGVAAIGAKENDELGGAGEDDGREPVRDVGKGRDLRQRGHR